MILINTDKVWPCARQQDAQYGKDAATHAAMRSHAHFVASGLAGQQARLRSFRRVDQLSSVAGDPTCR